MSLEKLFQDFVRYVPENHVLIEGVAVADEKKVLLEHRFTPDQARPIHSHTKSYLSAAVGLAIADGKMSLDDRPVDYFPEFVPPNPQPWLQEITLHHLLSMSSGFGRPLLMGEIREGVGLPDYAAYVMAQEVKEKPGTHFVYSNGDSILAGRMVAKAVGKHLAEYLYERLFSKLGQGLPVWEHEPRGHALGATGLEMRLTEMMKLGQLFLADGVWNGERILEHDWIERATKAQIGTDDVEGGSWWDYGYGYQFWMSPYPDSYRADGAHGQVTTVLPHSGLVVAVQCQDYGDFGQMWMALDAELLSQL